MTPHQPQLHELLEDLEKKANAAESCRYIDDDEMSEFHEAANPETVKKLIAALRVAEEAIELPNKVIPGPMNKNLAMEIDKVLAFFEQWLAVCFEARGRIRKILGVSHDT